MLSDTGETGLETSDTVSIPDGDGSLIVVIDDLEDMRHLIGATLTERGYRVLKAANGEDTVSLWNPIQTW